MAEFGVDAQTGFGPDRGTIDGLFTTFVGLHKREEHGIETWALYIDLLKAFGTVSRGACSQYSVASVCPTTSSTSRFDFTAVL